MAVFGFLRSVSSAFPRFWLHTWLFALCTLFFISAAYAQETHSTITDSGGSLLNRQNQALLHKMLDEARHTRGLIDAILPQGFHGTTCASGSKLLWRSSPKAEWYCQPETDGTVKAFGKTALPTCGANEYLYPETPTQFGCRALNLKGAIGAAPAWQWSADGHSLRVQAPNGTWGPWVYLRGDSGCYYKWLIGAWSACSSSLRAGHAKPHRYLPKPLPCGDQCCRFILFFTQAVNIAGLRPGIYLRLHGMVGLGGVFKYLRHGHANPHPQL